MEQNQGHTSSDTEFAKDAVQSEAVDQSARLGLSTNEKAERNWALAAHLSTLTWCIGVPGFIGPLVVWLVKKDELPFASDQAKEALNFQISLFAYAILCLVLILTVIGALIGFPGLIILGIAQMVFAIIASIQAGEGKSYRYPMTFRLIK